MTKTYNMADICEEAHNRLLKDPEVLAGARHSYYNRHDEEVEYTKLGNKIFNYYFEEVDEEYRKNGYTLE